MEFIEQKKGEIVQSQAVERLETPIQYESRTYNSQGFSQLKLGYDRVAQLVHIGVTF